MNYRRVSDQTIRQLQGLLVSALLIGLALSAWGFRIGQAATTITVTSFEDKINTDGFCTLREAIIAANKDNSNGNPGECPAGSGADIIVLPATINGVAGTYTLNRTDNGKEDASATGDLDITSDITILGDGGKVVINAIPGFKDRIFHVLAGTTTLTDLTIQAGSPAGDGGGIYNKANLTVRSSTLSGNTATGNGGAIYNSGSLALTNVTISGNSTNQSGGGLYNTTGTVNLNNVTVSANVADKDANGTGDGGGLFRQSGTLGVANTLIGGNRDGSAANKQQPDCSGSLASQGYNLVQNLAGCTLSGTATGNQTGVDPKLDPLGDYGGSTPTHRLQPTSPAIDKGNPAAPGSSSSACATTDQRGLARPQGAACDIGAFEAEDPLQTGPVFNVVAVVGSNEDRDDGACTFSHCSLREAIRAANNRPNIADLAIHFNLSGGNTIHVGSPLPEITSPVFIDGTTQPGGTLILDGSGAGMNVNGLIVTGGGSTIKGLTIQKFSCNGVLLTSSVNTIQGNTITQNGCDGIRVQSGTQNRLTANLISANGLLGIDLGGDGPTDNDTGDGDAGANGLQNFPVLFGADPYIDSANGNTVVFGRLNGAAGSAYNLEFFSNQTCDASGFGEAETFLGAVNVTTDSQGDAYFQANYANLPVDRFVTVTATRPNGDTSELSACKRVDARNDAWPAALQLTLPQNGSPAVADQYLDQQGQSRWYTFQIQPNSQLVITLTNLPANYDLTLYKDIKQAYTQLTSDQDLVRLGAEFAGDAFNADSFSSDAFNADAFSPQAFSPQAFSPQAFSPQAFSPQAFSPQAFSPQAFSPDAFLADAYSPQAFSPQAFSPQAFSPQAFSPQAFSPQAFSSAQTRSLIGVSAFDGTASEGLILNTWDNRGEFYVRVRGRNGAFDPSQKFHLEVSLVQKDCKNVNTVSENTSLTGVSGGYHTIIVTDFSRLTGSPTQIADLQQKLAAFNTLPEVRGVLVDVGTDARVAAANAEADRGDNYQCPFAKNQVAYAIKSVIDNYRAKNSDTLEYIVIIGNDEVVPFFRHADQAMLANEKNYAPPVLDTTASQASLKLGYVLSQDRYGTDLEISHKDESFPVPDLAVGRLVETAADASRMLDAYMKTNGGVMPTPTSALVTGYDFLVDNAEAVRDDLAAGLGSGSTVDSLITPANLSPEDPSAWTADDLRARLFGARHDLIYLAGHFSASGALAADFSTHIESSELINLPDNLLENALIYSAGCHSGYNIVDPHGVPFVTREPDWAEAANSQGITLIAGTGYQYGDTDFVEYSERLYLEFTRQLRAGSGAVPIGKALVEAKQVYLAGTPQLRGIHEKALLEATLFGLPMYAVNMPGQRYSPVQDDTLPIDLQGYPGNPGLSLGLEYSDVTINPALTRFDVPLKNVEDNTTVTATYLKGKNGVITNPVEPVMPAAVYNVSRAGTVLRGVGFREGNYTDLQDILPLIGAATTEVRGVHSPFVTEFFFPVRTWSVNYWDALLDGPTRLVVIPAQFRLDDPSKDVGILRQFNSLRFRLFYSDYGSAQGDEDGAALSAAPSIVQVKGTPAGEAVDFQMRVVGNPAAGIQEVWVTYTAVQGSLYGKWQSLDLAQNASDTTLWQGRLSVPQDVQPDQVRYIVQAVNGVGLVAFDTNQGAYHIPRFAEPPTQPTTLALVSPPSSGAYGTQVEFAAELRLASGGALPGQFITFSLGPQSRRVQTGPDGRATASLSLLGVPGTYPIKVTFPGTAEFIASKAESPFTITKQSTAVQIKPQSATVPQHQDTGIVAIVCEVGSCINDQGEDTNNRRLGLKTVFFVVEGSNGAASKAVITDYAGRAPLGSLALPAGTYTVTAYFGGEIPLKTNGTVTTVTQVDERYFPSSASGTLTLTPANNHPVCSNANAQTSPSIYLGDLAIAWPPNSQLVPVTVVGLSDPDGDPVTYLFTGIFQDERVGRGPASPDGFGVGTSEARVRAERDQNGNGRMYHLSFTASDGMGGTCQSEVLVGVPADQGGTLTPIDSGPPYYDSTKPG